MRIAALAKRYKKLEALSRVDARASRPGEAFGLVGANGAGKTTLIKCMLDLTACDAGTIEIFGIAARNPAARRRLAYLPERFNPPYYLRGARIPRHDARTRGSALRRSASGRRYAMSSSSSARRSSGRCDTLSKGMTQKLGLAGLLAACRATSTCSTSR